MGTYPIAVVMLLLVLVDTAFVATATIHRNCSKIIIGNNFLLFMIPGMFSNTIFGTEDHVATIHSTVEMIGETKFAFFAATILLPNKIAVFSPKILAVPI